MTHDAKIKPLRAAAMLAAAVSIAAPAAAEPVEVTDQTGETIRLEAPAERVVTIPMPAASMFIAVDGSADKLAGMHQASKDALLDGVLGEFYPGAADVRSDVVGAEFVPNIETLLAADPDVVFQWADRGTDVISPMTSAGLNVVGLRYGTQELAEGWIRIMGAVAGQEEKAARLIDWQQSALADMKERVAAVPEEDRPRVLYFLRFLSDKKVAGEGTYQDSAIELAGGINPADDLSDFPNVNLEQIVAWDPEVILLNNFESGLDPQDVYDDPLLAGVSAVKNRRVYRMPLGGYRWDPPSQESPLAWHWLAMVFHGDAIDFPIRDEIREAYAWIYGETPTDAQIDEILHVELNRGAAGYDRFGG